MASKEKPSKKAVKEKQKKAIEDSTFGLKNKNKSKKVQQFINRVEKSVKHSGQGLEMERARELKKEAKLAKQLQEEQMRLLFQEAIGNQFGVKKSKAAANAAALGLHKENKDVTAFLETLSEEEDDDDSSDDDLPMRDTTEGEGAEEAPTSGVEVFREKTIEDIIDEQRARLAADGKRGTPVTEESFAKWRAEKQARKAAEMEARVKAEQTKKKGGKGLSVLSGKELFTYNASLFIDDDSAFDTTNDSTLDAEMKELARREAELLAQETERAQAEQARLMEVQMAELNARQAQDDARRQAAAAPHRVMVNFHGVMVNTVVFEDDEDDDLALFPHPPFLKYDVRQLFRECNGDLEKVFQRLSLGGDEEEEEDEDGDDDGEEEGEEENPDETAVEVEDT